MDPITASGIFATVIGLICNYISQKAGNDQAEFDDFLVWLEDSHHSELKTLITENSTLSISIKALINSSVTDFRERLEKIDRILAGVAAHIQGVEDLAVSLRPEIYLSDQAVSIAKQFAASGASKFIEIKMLNNTLYQYLDAQGGVDVSEPRFIEDDLMKLVNLGLLILDFNGRGDRLFRITRDCVRFCASLA